MISRPRMLRYQPTVLFNLIIAAKQREQYKYYIVYVIAYCDTEKLFILFSSGSNFLFIQNLQVRASENCVAIIG